MLEAIVLDWAGTAVDFGSRAPISAFCDVFKAHGVAISIDEARGPMGSEKKAHIRSLLSEPRIRAAWVEVHGAEPSEAQIDQMYADLTPLTREQIASHSALIPGVTEAIADARARGCRIGSTTGYGRGMIDGMLAAAEAQGYAPDYVVAADEIAQPRPAAQGVLKNLVALDVRSVQHCVKVDDTAPGIAEGLNAGMWTVAVAVSGNAVALGLDEWQALSENAKSELRHRAHESLRATGAHFVIDTVAELPGVLDEIEARLARGERP